MNCLLLTHIFTKVWGNPWKKHENIKTASLNQIKGLPSSKFCSYSRQPSSMWSMPAGYEGKYTLSQNPQKHIHRDILFLMLNWYNVYLMAPKPGMHVGNTSTIIFVVAEKTAVASGGMQRRWVLQPPSVLEICSPLPQHLISLLELHLEFDENVKNLISLVNRERRPVCSQAKSKKEDNAKYPTHHKAAWEANGHN